MWKSLAARGFLSRAYIKIKDFLIFARCWLEETNYSKLSRDLGWAAHTISDWQQFLRDLCAFDEQFLPHTIGGEGCTVEIDEVLMSKRKNNVGQI